MNKSNDSTAYKNRVAKFTRWMKEVNVIKICIQNNYITLKDFRSF